MDHLSFGNLLEHLSNKYTQDSSAVYDCDDDKNYESMRCLEEGQMRSEVVNQYFHILDRKHVDAAVRVLGKKRREHSYEAEKAEKIRQLRENMGSADVDDTERCEIELKLAVKEGKRQRKMKEETRVNALRRGVRLTAQMICSILCRERYYGTFHSACNSSECEKRWR